MSARGQKATLGTRQTLVGSTPKKPKGPVADIARSYDASMSGSFHNLVERWFLIRQASESGSSNSEAWALLQLIQFPADPQEV